MELRVFNHPEKGKGPFFEFNIDGTSDRFSFEDESSLYMQDDTFNAFVNCFDISPDKLNYYGPTCYGENDLLILRRTLEAYAVNLEAVTGMDAFIRLVGLGMGSDFLYEVEQVPYNLPLEWQTVRNALREISRILINLVERCLAEKRNLWLLGI
jgi:hypothetical protein